MRGGILALGGGIFVVAAACASFEAGLPSGSSSGSTSDSGTPDASHVSDAEVDAGCPSGAVFCDDFESNSLAHWDSSELAKGGTVSVAGVPGESNHALQAYSAASDAGGTSAVEAAGFAASLPGTVAIRARVRFARPPGNNLHVLTLLGFPASDTARQNPSVYHGVVAYPNRWRVETFTPTPRYVEVDTSVAPPLDSWTCVELDVTLSPESGHVRFFVNDKVVVDRDAATLEKEREPVGDLVLEAGFVTDAPIDAQEVFVDDVVVKAMPETEGLSTPRIGCAP